MDNVIIQEATEDDAAIILDVLREANAPYRHRPGGPSGAFSDTVDATRTLIGTAHVAVALVEGTIVGCLFSVREKDYCFFFRLAVRPAFQRQGIGRRLIAYTEAHALMAGVTTMRLGVRRAMPENRDYYEGLGYHVIAETHADWKMEKRWDTNA
jgi:GNAT superfamily N-acetyltransferase